MRDFFGVTLITGSIASGNAKLTGENSARHARDFASRSTSQKQKLAPRMPANSLFRHTISSFLHKWADIARTTYYSHLQ